MQYVVKLEQQYNNILQNRKALKNKKNKKKKKKRGTPFPATAEALVDVEFGTTQTSDDKMCPEAPPLQKTRLDSSVEQSLWGERLSTHPKEGEESRGKL